MQTEAEGPIAILKSLFDEPSRFYLDSLLTYIHPEADFMYVYIMASRDKTLYIGVTNNIVNRTHQHKMKAYKSFTATYNCTKLVYIEVFNSPSDAINREKQLKRWNRAKKIRLIKNLNPAWIDLSAFLPKWDEYER